jgi:hypothetical protein
MDEAITQPTALEGGGEAAAPQSQETDWGQWMDDIAAGVTTSGQDPADDDDRGPVPYGRFEEVVRARQDADERLEYVAPWEASLELLQQLNVDPYTFAEHLERQLPDYQPAQPEGDRFGEWLTANDIDPDECTRAELVSLEQAWWNAEFRGQVEHAQAEAQEGALRAQWQADLQTLSGSYPLFRDPVMRDALLNSYETQYGVQPNQRQLAELAGDLTAAVEAQYRVRLADYQRLKEGDGMFPVFAGGAAPAPTETANFHDLPLEQQLAMMRSHRQAVDTAT